MVKMASSEENISFIILVGHHKNLDVETIYKLAMIGDVFVVQGFVVGGQADSWP
jgi:hypothetical protein